MIKFVEIENNRDFILRGLLDLPEGAKEIVVMLHGYTGNRTEHNGHFRTLSRMLSKNKIASLRMDYHGNGESDGEFSDFIFEDAVDDAKRMLSYAKEIPGIEKVDLLGFSMGGAISSLIANDDLNKLVLWSPAGTMKMTAHNSYDKWVRLPNGNAYAMGFQLNKKFVDSIDKFDFYSNNNFHKETLLVHGTKDLAVNPDCSRKYHELFTNSTIHFIEGAGHGYDAYEQANELYNVTVDFLTNRK